MARSPLLKALRQAYRIDQISRKSDIPPTEVISRLNEKLSRRRLLQGGLALAGAAAATTFRRDNQTAVAQSGASPVLVVGAGIAGLTAAYRLKQAGVPVDIIEARNQVSGRIRSLPKAAGTQITAELGGEFIDTDHTCLRGLAEELGFNIIDLLAAEQGLIQETYFFGGRKVPIEEIINDFAPVAEQIDADLVAIENFESYAIPDPATAALDNLSITEYLERIPTTATMRQIIQVAYTGEYGREAEEQSCLNLIYLIGTESGEFEIYGTSDERYYIAGGNDQVPRRLGELLANSLRTETVLESLSRSPDGRYQVALRSGGSTSDRTYERILLTYLVGQWTQMYGVEGERVGNLFFAGEHCSLEYQGYMEGGCETGEAAAAEILEDLGLQAHAVQQKTRFLKNRRARFSKSKRLPIQQW